VEKTFGINHPIAIDARQELLRIQALEKSSIPEKPMHEAIGDVAFRLDKLSKKLEHQRNLMAQASFLHHQAGERVTELASNIEGTQSDISNAQAERHNLLAACHLSTKKMPRTSSGPDALEHFLEGAGGLVDPGIIIKLREQISAIDTRMQGTPKPTTQVFQMAGSSHSGSGSDRSGTSTPRSDRGSNSPSASPPNLATSPKGNLTSEVNRTSIHLQMARSSQIAAKKAYLDTQQSTSEVYNDQHYKTTQRTSQETEDADRRLHSATVAHAAAKLALTQYTTETGSGRTPIPQKLLAASTIQ
jgi:hypothetical protein